MNEYRAKSIKTDKWAYGFIDWEIRDDGGKDYYIHTGYDKGFEEFELVDYETIGQSTGFEDKNGKMIYAGSKITFTPCDGLGTKKQQTATVYYSKVRTCFCAKSKGWDMPLFRNCENIEIIHEDKE